MADTVRNHRCEPITQVERAHFDVPPLAVWCLSDEQRHGVRGWKRHRRFVADIPARDWCARIKIPFPGDVPASCAHDPDHGVTAPADEASP